MTNRTFSSITLLAFHGMLAFYMPLGCWHSVSNGPRVDDLVVVLNGLHAGERIVSSANFLVDSEAQLQAAIGSFAPPPPGAGAAAAMNAPTQQIEIELSTEPAPPRKGANTVRVKLTAADGNPEPGAQVSATFFMPGMPAMGMAAMRAVVTLTDKGNGLYEGPLQLDSGGTWSNYRHRSA